MIGEHQTSAWSLWTTIVNGQISIKKNIIQFNLHGSQGSVNNIDRLLSSMAANTDELTYFTAAFLKHMLLVAILQIKRYSRKN